MLRCGAFNLSLDRPLIMGIVNLTPDSFSGDGTGADVDRAVAHARAQLDAGADILDLGAESSRPGAVPTPAEEELRRLLPVLAEIGRWGVPVSVDTYKPVVMRAALEAGASMINDISALADPESYAVVGDFTCAVCLMHMQGVPGSMQQAPRYDNVVDEVRSFLAARVGRCLDAGIEAARLVVDPGFGFGKTLEHNLALLRGLTALSGDGVPVLAGLSRKSMLGQITEQPVGKRLAASIAAALLAARNGAKILRVHDVAETRDALAIFAAVDNGEGNDSEILRN
jgi:dihydropteroate synthase